MVEKQLTRSPVKGEKLKRTRLSPKALTSWCLSIHRQLSPARTGTHRASANTSSHRLVVEAVETNRAECVFSHFSQAFKMTCAPGRGVTSRVFFCLKLRSERSTAAMGSRVVNVVLVSFVRSFSLGPTVTRTNALAVIRMLRRTGAKSRRCKEEVGEGRSETEDIYDCFAAKPQTICHNRQKQTKKSLNWTISLHHYHKKNNLVPTSTKSAKHSHMK